MLSQPRPQSCQCILALGWLPGSSDTALVGVGLTPLAMCTGKDVVQEGGGWVVFATVQIYP